MKPNQKVVRITLSTYDKPSLNMKKKIGQIVLYLEIFNFKTFRAEILQIFELVIWKIDDFINSFWLYLTFSLPTKKSESSGISMYKDSLFRKGFFCLLFLIDLEAFERYVHFPEKNYLIRFKNRLSRMVPESTPSMEYL